MVSTTSTTSTIPNLRRALAHLHNADDARGAADKSSQAVKSQTSTEVPTTTRVSCSLSTSAGYNMRQLAASLMLTIVLLWCVVPAAHGFAILESPSSLDQRSPNYDADLMRKVVILSKLLNGKRLRLPSGLLTSLQNNHGDERRLVAGKRGPTSCINNCLTNGMTFVRCKSMCHW